MNKKLDKFSLEDAFKALDEIQIPRPEKHSRRIISEGLSKDDKLSKLLEDYYDISNPEELDNATKERENEVAQAKLDRIEKIVDLDAKSPEDLQPSYVGKLIIQCPQCMTLFYKNAEDVNVSDEDPKTVNVGEVCQHCGNDSGYMLMGKVDEVASEEAAATEEPMLDDIPAEENNDEVQEEPAEDEIPELEEIPDELPEDEVPEEEEKKEESFTQPTGESLMEAATKASTNEVFSKLKNTLLENIKKMGYDSLDDAYCAIEKEVDDDKIKFWFLSEFDYPTCNKIVTELDNVLKECGYGDSYFDAETSGRWVAYILENTINEAESLKDESLNEDVDKDLNKKLEEHNEYIGYLQKMIEQEEEALAKATNEFVKNAIQRRIDAFKADLEAAIPDEVKNVTSEEVIEDNVTDEDTFENDEEVDEFDDTEEDITEEVEKNDANINESLSEDTVADKIKQEVNRFVENDLNEDAKLDDSDAAIDDLFNSKEFTTPISDAEVRSYFEEEVDEVNFDELEDLDEATLNLHITEYLQEVYDNVVNFKTTNCNLDNNKLYIEGMIKFTSGKTKPTLFEFYNEGKKIAGKNEALAEGKAFILNYKVSDKKLFTESLKYNYKINDTLVRGIK